MLIKMTCVDCEIAFAVKNEVLDLSLFPKYTKVYHSHWYGPNQTEGIDTDIIVGLTPDGVNQGKNEAGMKRAKKVLGSNSPSLSRCPV